MPETTLTWLGHATFRFDTPGGKRVYIDPFLNGNPKCPESELEPERIDVIALTHGHGDHVGDTVELAKKHACTVIAPVELADWLQMKHELQSVLDPNKGGTVEAAGECRSSRSRGIPQCRRRRRSSSTASATCSRSPKRSRRAGPSSCARRRRRRCAPRSPGPRSPPFSCPRSAVTCSSSTSRS